MELGWMQAVPPGCPSCENIFGNTSWMFLGVEPIHTPIRIQLFSKELVLKLCVNVCVSLPMSPRIASLPFSFLHPVPPSSILAFRSFPRSLPFLPASPPSFSLLLPTSPSVSFLLPPFSLPLPASSAPPSCLPPFFLPVISLFFVSPCVRVGKVILVLFFCAP